MVKNYIHICYRCMTPLYTESGICPVCGYNNETTICVTKELPPGHVLHARYLVGCSVTKNQFVTRYLGYDCKKGNKIWVEELFPRDYAVRQPNDLCLSVTDQTAVMQSAIKATMQTAGKFRDAGIIKGVAAVQDFFSENGTVYVISEWLEGQFLDSDAAEQRFRHRIEAFVAPMAMILSRLHEKRIVHGALHPGSILITPEGKPVLVGVGSGIVAFARLENEKKADMTCFLAPECMETGMDACGIQTDVYELAALVCWIITGDGFSKETVKELDTLTCSSVQKEALIGALQEKPNKRIQSIMRFYEFFSGEVTVVPNTAPPIMKRKKGARMVIIGAILMALGLLTVLLGMELQIGTFHSQPEDPAALEETILVGEEDPKYTEE